MCVCVHERERKREVRGDGKERERSVRQTSGGLGQGLTKTEYILMHFEAITDLIPARTTANLTHTTGYLQVLASFTCYKTFPCPYRT